MSSEEGTFYEHIFGPVEVEVKVDPKTGKRTGVVLRDKNGETITVREKHALRRLYHYLRLPLKLPFREIYSSEPEKQQKLLNASLKTKPRKLKFLFDESGEIKSVATKIHKQISWREVRKAVETAINQVYGGIEVSDGLRNVWSYKMPIKNEKVSVWARVDAGNNIIKGRSAVRISTRLRTEFDTASRGRYPPCLNWANLWQTPLKFFDIEVKRLSDLVDQPDMAMTSYDIHIKNIEIKPETFLGPLRRLKETAENVVIEELIERAVKEPLSLQEMEDILICYKEKVNLPKYIVEAILERVMTDRSEETVWGFSNAVSWVRTHAELRKGRLPREQRSLVQKLENIAGEIISLAPTIEDFHEKVGDITYERLMGKPKPKEEEIVISSPTTGDD